ncbi:unnamed protein product [Moneuplotes crassus]|uniref:Uncharacterized protein n=1 Tax=Euplotes crassus TaxID=5936 RepID=A0AAD1XT53_EUPCR|nr:unnamed protein product [Moneuplotes crassus]
MSDDKDNSTFKTDSDNIMDSVDSDSNTKEEHKFGANEIDMDPEERQKREEMKDFDTYLRKVLDDSIVKKSEITCLNFESWFVENGIKHPIKIKYQLGSKPHEITILEKKYQLKELYICDSIKSTRVANLWDLFVGAKVDVFGKPTILKKCCFKTKEWNKFYGAFLKEIKKTLIDEIKKYERKKFDIKIIKDCEGKQQGSINIAMLIKQVTALKEKMAKYRPALSNDIVIAFESLL